MVVPVNVNTWYGEAIGDVDFNVPEDQRRINYRGAYEVSVTFKDPPPKGATITLYYVREVDCKYAWVVIPQTIDPNVLEVVDETADGVTCATTFKEGTAEGQIWIWDDVAKKWKLGSIPIPAGTADEDILVWDETTDKAWEATAPTEITVVTAFQVSGLTLQVKTRTVKAISAGTESGWTTVHTGNECPT
jgi:hypothetical protein